MNIYLHDLMAFFHVVLFVYAIGGDIAVYYIGNYITKDELPIEERLRVRSMRFIVDMSARTSLVLLLPIGFTLATAFGSSIDGIMLQAIWVFSIIWLILIWVVHFKRETQEGETFRIIDLGIRYILSLGLFGLGLYSLFSDAIIPSNWLALKVSIFGLILMNGIWIRRIVGKMRNSILMVQNSQDKHIAEATIKKQQATLNQAALMIWILVITMAFLGQVKPF